MYTAKHFVLTAIVCCLFAAAGATPTNVQAFFRDGQTFITWTEDGSATYDIYRYTEAITSGTIGQATKIATVNNQSSNTRNGIGDPIGQTHWIIQPITSGTGLGTQLTDNDGLFVHTTHETSGDFYYAVTAGGSTTIASNTAGPIAEQKMVTKPVAVWRGRDANNRLHVHYSQFMDYSIWNTAFEGYIINYVAAFPAKWDTATGLMPIVNQFNGRSGRITQYHPAPSDFNISLFHDAVSTASGLQDWYYGHLNKDSTAVYNYTEYRVIKAILFTIADLKGDPNKIFAWSHSMGGSASLSLASRYPMIFSSVYCSQPATDWSNSGFAWYSDGLNNYGPRASNLPIYNIPYDDPARPDLDAHLQRYNGTPVWDWQNIRDNLTARAGDDMALICATHGTADGSIDWGTQGQPFGPAIRNCKRPFKYIVNNASHTNQNFNAVNWRQMFAQTSNAFSEYIFPLHESMPGFSGVADSLTMINCRWTILQDTRDIWEATIIAGIGRSTITPRRCQAFEVNTGDKFDIYVNDTLRQSNVLGDANGLVTSSPIILGAVVRVKFVNTFREVKVEKAAALAAHLALIETFPNPFNPDIQIRMFNPEKQRVRMDVYDLRGTLIKRLMDRDLPAGIFASAFWDGTNHAGVSAASGVYIVRTHAGAWTKEKRITLTR